MPFRFRVAPFANRSPAAIAAMAILALSIASCYSVQGGIPLILTPAAIPGPVRTAQPAPQEIVILEATVAASALHVRQQADASTPIIAGLLQDDRILIIGRTEDANWLRVRVPDVGTIGWIWAADVTLNEEVASLLVVDGMELAQEMADDSEIAGAAAPGEEGDNGELVADSPGEESADDDRNAAATPAGEDSDDSAVAAPSPSVEEFNDRQAALANLEPGITVHAQDVIKGKITIAEVVAQVEGWIAIHSDDAGALGPIIGQAPLRAGVTTDLVVAIDVDAATQTLYAMLHRDAGVFDLFEFPGADMPVLDDGQPISPSFSVTIGEMSIAEEGADADEVAAAPAPDTTLLDTPLLSPGDVATHVAFVTTRALRVRGTPETIAEVLAGVAVGEAYPVAGFSADEDWVAIFFPSIDEPVWVSASLVTLQEIEFRVQIGRATIATPGRDRLRLRGEPSLDAPIVGYVLGGDEYLTLGLSVDGQWALLVGTDVEDAAWASVSFLFIE